jgi:hypothetical protein
MARSTQYTKIATPDGHHGGSAELIATIDKR